MAQAGVVYKNVFIFRHIYMVRAGGGAWRVEWAVKLDDLIDAPRAVGDKLVLNIKQVSILNKNTSRRPSNLRPSHLRPSSRGNNSTKHFSNTDDDKAYSYTQIQIRSFLIRKQ